MSNSELAVFAAKRLTEQYDEAAITKAVQTTNPERTRVIVVGTVAEGVAVLVFQEIGDVVGVTPFVLAPAVLRELEIIGG